jgi:hypothetical protein
MMKGIYAEETSAAEICTEVAYILGSLAEESESCTSGVVEVETVNATMDDGKEARRHVTASASCRCRNIER